MTTRSLLLAVLMVLGLAAAAAAAAPPPAAHGARASRPKAGRTAASAARPTRSADRAPDDSTAMAKRPAARPGAARTLDDIHIEGEIPVPQVLFITARDQRRFLEFQQRRYLETSLEIGERTVFPTGIAVARAGSLKPKEKTP